MTKNELMRVLSDPRCPGDAEVKFRIVDHSHVDGPHGSYRAMEVKIEGSFMGWDDGHWSILAFGPVSKRGARRS